MIFRFWAPLAVLGELGRGRVRGLIETRESTARRVISTLIESAYLSRTRTKRRCGLAFRVCCYAMISRLYPIA